MQKQSESDTLLKTMRLMNLAALMRIYEEQGDAVGAAQAAKEYVTLLLGIPVCAYCNRAPAKFAGTSVETIDTCEKCRVVQ